MRFATRCLAPMLFACLAAPACGGLVDAGSQGSPSQPGAGDGFVAPPPIDLAACRAAPAKIADLPSGARFRAMTAGGGTIFLASQSDPLGVVLSVPAGGGSASTFVNAFADFMWVESGTLKLANGGMLSAVPLAGGTPSSIGGIARSAADEIIVGQYALDERFLYLSESITTATKRSMTIARIARSGGEATPIFTTDDPTYQSAWIRPFVVDDANVAFMLGATNVTDAPFESLILVPKSGGSPAQVARWPADNGDGILASDARGYYANVGVDPIVTVISRDAARSQVRVPGTSVAQAGVAYEGALYILQTIDDASHQSSNAVVKIASDGVVSVLGCSPAVPQTTTALYAPFIAVDDDGVYFLSPTAAGDNPPLALFRVAR